MKSSKGFKICNESGHWRVWLNLSHFDGATLSRQANQRMYFHSVVSRTEMTVYFKVLAWNANLSTSSIVIKSSRSKKALLKYGVSTACSSRLETSKMSCIFTAENNILRTLLHAIQNLKALRHLGGIFLVLFKWK